MTLLDAGCPSDPDQSNLKIVDLDKHVQRLVSITQLVEGENTYDADADVNISLTDNSYINSCNLWLLAADNGSLYYGLCIIQTKR